MIINKATFSSADDGVLLRSNQSISAGEKSLRIRCTDAPPTKPIKEIGDHDARQKPVERSASPRTVVIASSNQLT